MVYYQVTLCKDVAKEVQHQVVAIQSVLSRAPVDPNVIACSRIPIHWQDSGQIRTKEYFNYRFCQICWALGHSWTLAARI